MPSALNKLPPPVIRISDREVSPYSDLAGRSKFSTVLCSVKCKIAFTDLATNQCFTNGRVYAWFPVLSETQSSGVWLHFIGEVEFVRV